MVLSLCFTCAFPHAKRCGTIHDSAQSASFTCTVTSELARTEQKIRVVPAGTPISRRPPLPPRHHSVPGVGYFLEYMLNLGPMACDKVEKYGSIFVSNYFLGEMVHVSDYATIVEISRAASVFKVGGANEGFEAMSPGNILSLDGDKHTEVRSAQSPAFSKSLLPLYYPLIKELSSNLWSEVYEACLRGERVVLQPYVRRHYVRSIVEISTGIVMDDALTERIQTLNDVADQGIVAYKFGPLANPAYNAQRELQEIIRDAIFNNIRQYADIIEKLRKCGDNFVKESIPEIRKGNLNLVSVLIGTSSLSVAPDAIHDPEVINELVKAVEFIWAAAITTESVTSLSAIFEFGFNQNVLEMLFSEQDAAMTANNRNQEVTYKQVMNEMPLLDSFLNETMRMHPADAQMFRIASEDVEILGKFIPKGTTLCLNTYSAHLNENTYKNAKQFVMDRFLRRESNEKVPPILTFGAPGNAHYCIGYAFAKMQMKCLLATLLRSYNIKLDETQSREFQYQPVIEPKSGVIVESFTRRK